MTKTLELLGYDRNDRVLLIHADDIGFSHGSNVAAFEGMSGGSLTCASVLAPAPWFAETAKLAKEHPEADFGVHMTLTAEYEVYRWRSLSGRPSLHAPDGGMWRTVADVVAHVPAADADAELRAQVAHAKAMGIDVTHLDTHMGTVMLPQYLPLYVRLAIEERVPVFFMRPSERRLAALGEARETFLRCLEELDAHRWPVLDNVIIRTLSEIAPEDKERRFRQFFNELRPGLTHFICHPTKGGEEIDAMSPDDCRHRAREYELFRSPALREYCESLGVKLVGYREVRDRMRAALPA
jgi:hypothetical protein